MAFLLHLLANGSTFGHSRKTGPLFSINPEAGSVWNNIYKQQTCKIYNSIIYHHVLQLRACRVYYKTFLFCKAFLLFLNFLIFLPMEMLSCTGLLDLLELQQKWHSWAVGWCSYYWGCNKLFSLELLIQSLNVVSFWQLSSCFLSLLSSNQWLKYLFQLEIFQRNVASFCGIRKEKYNDSKYRNRN